jgi:hypothetical protein
MLANVTPLSVKSSGLMPGKFTTGTSAPLMIGNCTKPFFATSSGLSGHVGGSEGNSPVGDLLDAAPGADGLIVETDAGSFLINIRPRGKESNVEPAPVTSPAAAGKKAPPPSR